jgi:hypothetical protein
VRIQLQDDRRRRLGTDISDALVLFLSMTLGLAMGCAELKEVDPPPEVPIVTVACANNLTEDQAILEWQLEVFPNPIQIESDEPFSATLGGVVVFPEEFLDQAQPLIPGGVEEVNLVALNATVHVRSGASGPDVVLTVEPERDEYECAQTPTPCDPANDLPSVPGLVGNTDCEGESPLNPCGRFVRLPTSGDCDAGGICDGLNKTGPSSQCELNDFCITGDLELPLGNETGRYTADSEGHVLFGWDDGESTGATVQEGGPNDGTWILPDAIYGEEPGPVSLRLTVGRVQVALECTMGCDSKGPCGVGSLDFRSSPTPNDELIRFPIVQPF